jgi:hypothetical protein
MCPEQIPFVTSAVQTYARKRNSLRALGGGDLVREDVVGEGRFGSQSGGGALQN